MKVNWIVCVIVVFSLFAAGHTANGHSGYSATALPVSDITVDGDLSDWSDELPHYAVQTRAANAVFEEGDCEGRFRVGYGKDDCCLYVALEVDDDRVVIDGDNELPSWLSQDSCEIYVDVLHRRKGGQPYQFYFRQEYGAFSEENAGAGTAVRSVHENRIVYEFKIDLKKLGEGLACPGVDSIIGFDVVIVDHDTADDVSHVHFGSNDTDKWMNSLHLADLMITDHLPEFGEIRGQFVWKENWDKDNGSFPSVSIQSILYPNARIQAKTKPDGTYSVMVPKGSYSVGVIDEVDHRIVEPAQILIDVEPDHIVETMPLELSPLEKPGLIGDKGILHRPGPVPGDEIDRFVSAYMDYYMIPGLSIAVIKDSTVAYFRTFGVKNADTKEPVQGNTLFEAASMTKPVFAFAVNRLVERGVIDLDTPLFEYQPKVQRVSDVWDDERLALITARHVLTHRTGFPNWRGSQKLKIGFKPGTKFGYSGEGFEYLGAVVSHLTGKKLVDVVQEEVFTPLGIDNAYLVCDDEVEKLSATGHSNGVNPLPKWKMDEPVMAASLHIDAYNYAKFLIAILEREGLSKPIYDELLRLQFEVADPEEENPFGLGIVVQETPLGMHYSHGGFNTGFKCYSGIYDDLKMGYVCLTNNEHGDRLCEALDAFLITGKHDDITDK